MVWIVALAVRVLYVVLIAGDRPIIGDALNYHLYGERIGTGHGMVSVSRPDLERPVVDPVPTAQFPPLFPYLVGLLHAIGVTTVFGQKLALAVLGSVTPVLLALAARELTVDTFGRRRSERAGIAAGSIAAVYPFLWVVDGSLMSETLFGVLLAGMLWAVFGLRRRPTVVRAAVVGTLIGLATLTRTEAIMIGAALVVIVAITVDSGRAARARLVAAAALTCVAVLTPWTIRNLIVFEEPVFVATNSTAVFAGANCDGTYRGESLGGWLYVCYGEDPMGDESQWASEYRRRGMAYAREHADRLPVVVLARVGRTWGVVAVDQQTRLDIFEGRLLTATRAGLVMYYPLVVLAVVGAVALGRRDRGGLATLVAVLAVVTLMSAVAYGSTRFRFAAEPVLVLLGAVGITAILERRWSTGPAVSEHDDEPVPTMT